MQPEPTVPLDAANLPAHSTHSISATAAEVTASGASPGVISGEEFPRQISRFVIRKRLGSGGFGSVYLAYDPVLDREIALKVPRGPVAWANEQTQSFLAEARIVNKGRAPTGRICASQGDNAIQITSILPDRGDYSAIL